MFEWLWSKEKCKHYSPVVVTTQLSRMTELGPVTIDVPFWYCHDCEQGLMIFSDDEIDKQFEMAVENANSEARRQ